MKAYMIMDLDNPVSVAYSKMSIESFKPVEDLIEIIPYQCTRPKDIEWIDDVDRWGVGPLFEVEGHKFSIWTQQLLRSGHRNFTESEKATIVSHLRLWLKPEEEQFIILEHDAYLLDEQKFRKDFSKMDRYGVWMPGIALECYSFSPMFKEYLTWKMTIGEWNTFASGPMGYLEKVCKQWVCKWPMNGKNLLQNDGSNACVTQIYSKELGITIDHTLKIDYSTQKNIFIVK